MNQEIYDYILLMLGAPVTKVELDKKQIDMCITQAETIVNKYQEKGQRKVDDVEKLQLIKDGALANSMIVLGFVRSKEKITDVSLSAEILLKEGQNNKDNWLDRLHMIFFFDDDRFMQILNTLLSNCVYYDQDSLKKCIDSAMFVIKEVYH